MPLVTTSMPCGFDDGGGLVMNSDFDWSTNSSATSTAEDCYDPLFYSSSKDHLQDVIITGSKEQQPSWCRSSSSGSNKSSNNHLSSSSYCRRLGSAASGMGSSRRPSSILQGSSGSGATFQLWSPRLRQRDERKRVLKLSLAKLRRIDDAESCLRRSVLINNTLRRLQRETQDEKNPHSSAFYQRLVDETTLGSTSLLLTDLDDEPVECTISPCPRLQVESNPSSSSSSRLKRRRISCGSGSDPSSAGETSSSTASLSLLLGSEGLSLSELYSPPPITPRMISSLDDHSEEDESASLSTSAASAKRSKLDLSDVSTKLNRPALRPCNSLMMTSSSATPVMTSSGAQNSFPSCGSGSVGLSLLGQQQSSSTTTTTTTTTASTSYSCGQSSLFGELQSVVFHSLITSLES